MTNKAAEGTNPRVPRNLPKYATNVRSTQHSEDANTAPWNSQDAYARFDRLLQNIQLSPQSRKNLIPTGVVGSGTSITNGSASPAATTSRSGANRSTGSVVGSSKNSKNSAVSKTANATYRNPSSFQASGSDCEASTFEQLMGELHMNGGCGGFRKRNWDRNGRPTSDDRSASIANYWSKLPDAPVWPSDGNNYIQHSPYRNMVPPGDGSAASSRESAVVRPPRGDAKDLTFWTNVFFKNGNDVSPTILHPPRVHTTPNKDRHHQQRKSAASSLVMGLLDTSPTSTTPNETGDQIGATAMNGGHSSSSSTPSRTTSSYLYADGGLNAASSFDYAAIQSGIKRKNNLSKSKVANGPPDRFAKTTDLFLLPSGGSGVYSTLGMPDVSPSTDGSRFIQALDGIRFDVTGAATLVPSATLPASNSATIVSSTTASPLYVSTYKRKERSAERPNSS